MRRCRKLCSLASLLLAVGCSSPDLTAAYGQLTATPATLDFGTVEPRSAASLQVTITNAGAGTVALRSVSVTGDSDDVFGVSGAPLDLGAGAAATLTVTVTAPAALGPYAATLVVSSNASGDPLLLVPLSLTVSTTTPAGDAGNGDAGLADAGLADAGAADAGAVDAGASDAGEADSGFTDSGIPDAGVFDAGSDDGGCPAGQMMCPNGCSDTRVDPFNCGGCGMSCIQPDMGCNLGMCLTCAPTSGFETLATGQGQPWGIAVDHTSVYWTAQEDETLMKVSVDGGTPEALATAAEFTFPASFQPTSIGLDQINVYFGDNTMQSVGSVPLGGGSPTNLGGTGAWPSKLAVGPTGVYWVTSTLGAVWRGLPTGSASMLVPAPSPGNSGESYEMLGVDSTSVYWIAQGSPANNFLDGAIMKVGLNGGTPSTVVSGLAWPLDGAVDATSVYWTSEERGTVWTVTSSGGTPVLLAAGRRSPRNLVIDDTTAYWSAGGTDGSLMSCEGTVESVPLAGGPVTVNVGGQYSAWGVAVDSTSLYWTDLYYGTVMKTPK